MTKVDIFSGFLGAGKTTLIKKLIKEAYQGQKLVLIENEFGEVGVDGGFLKDSGIQITEMNSGCICCTLVGDFDRNLREVVAKFSPDRIFIEPSGVGKLSDVAASVIRLEDEIGLELSGMVTVVNALKAKKQMKAFGEFFNDQIAHATTVILSRTQKATNEDLEFTVQKIKELNPNAKIITTPWDDLSGEKIAEVIEGTSNDFYKDLSMKDHEIEEAEHEAEHHHHHDDDEDEHEHHHHDHDEDEHEHLHDHDDYEDEHEHHHHDDDEDEHEHHHHHDDEDEHEHHHHDDDEDEHEHHHHDHDEEGHEHHHHHHHHADEVFDNWGIETPHVFKKSDIENALKTFADGDSYGDIIRSKGMVEVEDKKWIYFDFVDGEYELRDGEPDYTGRLVVIGQHIDEGKLKSLFGLEG